MKSREEIMQALDGAKELQVQQAKFMVNPAEMAVQAGINAPLIATTLALILEVQLDIRQCARNIESAVYSRIFPPLPEEGAGADLRCRGRGVVPEHEACPEYDDKTGNCMRLASGEKGCPLIDGGVPVIEVDDCGDPDKIREAARETLMRAQAEKEEKDES